MTWWDDIKRAAEQAAEQVANTWQGQTQNLSRNNTPQGLASRYGMSPGQTGWNQSAWNNLSRNNTPEGLASRYGTMQPGTVLWNTPKINTDFTRNYNPTGLTNRYGAQQPGTMNPWNDAFIKPAMQDSWVNTAKQNAKLSPLLQDSWVKTYQTNYPDKYLAGSQRWRADADRKSAEAADYYSKPYTPPPSSGPATPTPSGPTNGGYGGYGGYGGWGGGGGGGGGDVANWYANMVQWTIK